MSAVGATFGSLVRKTAVPGTRVGFDFSNIAISSMIGIESRWVFSARSRVPRIHVHMTIMAQPPSASGTQPPSLTFIRFAARKARSTTRNAEMSNSAAHNGQPHFRHTTTKASAVVTTMVPVTAMPYAEARADELLKAMTSSSTPMSSSRLMRPI